MKMGKKYIVLLFLILLLSGCNRTSVKIDSTINQSIENIEDIMALEKIEERLAEMGLVMGPHDNATLQFGYSRPCPLEDRTFGNYKNLISTLSESLKGGKIEETLQEMSREVAILSEEEVKQLVKDEPYGIFERFLEERAYYNYKITDLEWYLVEQTEQRIDLVVQQNRQIDGEDGWASYETFKCTKRKDGKIDAWYGLPAISNSEEHYFIEYNGLKYLCTPKRNKQGDIEGVATHIYDLEDIYGGVIYIEYINEIKVITYTLFDGKDDPAIPSYLEE